MHTQCPTPALQHHFGNVLSSSEIQELLADQLRTREVVSWGTNCDGEQETQENYNATDPAVKPNEKLLWGLWGGQNAGIAAP